MKPMKNNGRKCGLQSLVRFVVVAGCLGQAAPALGQAKSSSESEDETSQPTSQPTSQSVSSTQQPDPAASSRAASPTSQPADPYAGLDHTGTPSLPPKEARPPQSATNPGKKRQKPNYDGRVDRRPGAADVLVWLPRVALYPVHLVLEYLVRWPLVKGVTLAEEYHVFDKVERLLTWEDRRGGKGGFFPTVFFDFGLSPSVGLYSFYNNVWGSRHSLTLQAGFWPTNDWYHFIAGDSFRVFRDDSGTVSARVRYLNRPDFVFYGLGPSSLQANEAFYRLQQVEGEVSLRAALKDLNRFNFGLFYRSTQIKSSDDFGISVDEIDEFLDNGQVDPAQVPGWDDTYLLLEGKAKLELDTRSPDRIFTPGSGLRLELLGSFAFDPHDPKLNFFRWGGNAAGFWDVTGDNHVLAFSVYAEALENTGDEAVPLTELVQLGGAEYLRGFLAGRFHGDSALVFTADYRYPFWTFLDADIFVSMGNVFDGRWERLHAKRMVMNWGLALRTNTSRDVSFDFLVAVGTNQLQQWDDDFNIDNVRVTLGVNQGF